MYMLKGIHLELLKVLTVKSISQNTFRTLYVYIGINQLYSWYMSHNTRLVSYI